MELGTMSVEDCIKVLKFELLGSTEARGPRIVTEGSYIVDEPSMERLVKLLGRLPLAIIQAASFMRENSLMSSEYVSLYNDMETEHADFLNEEFVDWRRDSDMPNAVLCTWKLSFEKIKCKNELAVRMLLVLSALDSQGVSDWMLPYFPGAAKFQLTKAIALLRSFSFVSRRGNSMHRLVQVATRAWVGPDEWHSAVRDALRFLCNIFAGLNSNEWTSKGELSYSTLRKSLEYYPHTKSIIAALSTTPTRENGSLAKSTLDRFIAEWNKNGLRSEDFVKKANDIYHEITASGYQSLTDMILLVRGLSGGSGRYFYNLYKGPYGSADTFDPYSFSPEDLGYEQVALSAAAEYGDEELVNLLLESNKINTDSMGIFNGRTPLSRASGFGHERIVELLLKTGKVNVNLSDTKGRPGRTPLLWASVRGHTTVVKLLLETGEADINATDRHYGRTALSWAAGKGHVAIVKLLLETNKARIDAPDHYNQQTPLSWASEYGHVEIVKLLLGTGKVNINSISNGPHTPLGYAVGNGHAGVVKVLLETGQADVISLQRSWGLTPFIMAARGGHTEVVELLLKTGKVDINEKTEPSNKTALFWAMEEKQLEVVELLRAWGATA
jgi:ankyrin repeat protein